MNQLVGYSNSGTLQIKNITAERAHKFSKKKKKSLNGRSVIAVLCG